MRGDEHTVNGLEAYVLNETQSTTTKSASKVGTGDVTVQWGMRAYVRFENQSEVEMTSGESATVSRSSVGSGIQSNTWTCSQEDLDDIHAIRVNVYIKVGSLDWYHAASFITQQAYNLNSTTWTVYYYTSRAYSSKDDETTGYFKWRTSTYDSRIGNVGIRFEYEKPFSDSLVYLINNIASQIQEWNASDYQLGTVDIGIIFGYNDTSAFDEEIIKFATNQQWEEVFTIKVAAEHVDYSSSTIDEKTKWALGNISMFSSYSLPNSTNGYFSCWRRHLLYGYRYSIELNYATDRWNATNAFLGLKNVRDSKGHPFYRCDADAGTGDTALRWLEAGICMDCFFVLYEAGVEEALDYAIAEWEWLNDERWAGDHYKYIPEVDYEWSLSDVAPNVAKLHGYGESLENFSRIVTHTEMAYWNNAYNSPLWHPTEKVVRHAITNDERRLLATVNAYTYSHIFYSMMNEGNQTNFENMIEGNGETQLWRALNSSDLRSTTTYQFRGSSNSEYSDYATAIALLGLLLAGISPKSGRGLAIPIEADRKHAITGGLNSRLFGFSYSTSSIRIPVWGNSTLKFAYGNSYPNYTFAETGIYNVTFSPNWESITNVTKLSELPSDQKFLYKNVVADLSQAFASGLMILLRSSFNIEIFTFYVFSWIVDVAQFYLCIVDLSHTLLTTWTMLNQWTSIIDLTQSLTTT